MDTTSKNKEPNSEIEKKFNIEDTRKKQLLELNDAIDQIINKVNGMSEITRSSLTYIETFKQKINENSFILSDEIEINRIVHELRSFINTLELEKKKREELEIIIDAVEKAVEQLTIKIMDIQSDVKHLKENENEVHSQLNNLKTELDHLKKKECNRILTKACAHLLKPLIQQISEEFQTKNEQTKNTQFPTSYSLRNNYNKYILKSIKADVINDDPTKLVNNIISRFAHEAKLSKAQLIELLLNKTKRNYMAHAYLDEFIRDVNDGQCSTHDFIYYIESENDIAFCITREETDMLMKLLQYNIIHHRE